MVADGQLFEQQQQQQMAKLTHFLLYAWHACGWAAGVGVTVIKSGSQVIVARED